MATVQRFEDREVWQLVRLLCQKICPLTFQEPIRSDPRFSDQIRGACGSVMDNIAEGFGRRSRREFIYSLTYAKGERDESKSQLYRGLDNDYFTEQAFEELYQQASVLEKKLTSFINYLNRSKIKGQKFREEE
jgi:four helix bundle protein